MSDIEEEIKGTPIEELKKERDILHNFKTLEGYQVMVKHARGQEAHLLRMFMSDAVVDEKQLRADCRAWHNLVQSIDEKIDNYDNWLEQTLKMQKHQEQQLKGSGHGR